jgi:hypothetical protein
MGWASPSPALEKGVTRPAAARAEGVRRERATL